MDTDKEGLRKAFGSTEEGDRKRRILGKIDSEIADIHGQPENQLRNSNSWELARVRNEADRALAIDRELSATRLETRLDDLADSLTPQEKLEIEKEIRRLRK